MRFTGLRAVVTGAASGIGAEVARALSAEGASVTGLDLKDAEHVERTIRTDLSSVESVDAAVAALGGGWDVLCNVAGVPGTAAPATVLSVNLLGLRHLTESLLPSINSGGAIVNVASTAGYDWPTRRDAIRELHATGTVDEGLAWFAAHPQEGNTYSFAKEVLIVARDADGARVLGDGRAAQRREPRAGEHPRPRRLRGDDGQGHPRRRRGVHRAPRRARRHRPRGAVPGLARGAPDQRPQHRRRRGISAAVLSGLVPAPEI